MTQGKSPATALSCWLQITTDYTFKIEVHNVSKLPVVPKIQAVKGLPYLDGFISCSFNFDGLYFWNHWGFRDVMYLIYMSNQW